MELRLTNGGVALIDDDAYERTFTLEVWAGVFHTFRICDCSWRHKDKSRISYVQTVQLRDSRLCTVRLHRLILEAPKGLVVDHIDRNPRNNVKANLRLCDAATNNQNRVFEKKSKRGLYVNQHTGETFVRTFVDGKEKLSLVS